MELDRPEETPMVRSARVTFESEGEQLVGTLYQLAQADNAEPRPAVVVAGSWTTVKEQMAGLYARRLAQLGYLALAFDFTGHGESTGHPRDTELVGRKVGDMSSAVSHLLENPMVDPESVGLLGVCAGGGYAAVAAANDPGCVRSPSSRPGSTTPRWCTRSTAARTPYAASSTRRRSPARSTRAPEPSAM